jgi:hypothetical protein
VAKKIVPVCTYCGSTFVIKDAFAVWNVEEQEWELGDTLDDGSCSACGEDQKSFNEEEVPNA